MGKMYLNGILYGIENRFRYDLLLENTDFTPDTSGNSKERSYTLRKSIDEYDAVVVFGWLNVSSTAKDQLGSILIMNQDFYTRALSDTSKWVFLLNGSQGSGNRRLVFRFANNTTIETLASKSNTNEEPRLWKIYGLKFPSNDASVPAFLHGKTAPSNSVGENGNLFLQTNNSETFVSNIYSKIGGSWLQIPNYYVPITNYTYSQGSQSKYGIISIPTESTTIFVPEWSGGKMWSYLSGELKISGYFNNNFFTACIIFCVANYTRAHIVQYVHSTNPTLSITCLYDTTDVLKIQIYDSANNPDFYDLRTLEMMWHKNKSGKNFIF